MAAAGGADATIAALRAWGERTRAATVAAGGDAAKIVKERIQENLGQREYPPAAPIGEPPAKRSGFLQDNVFITELDSPSGIMERIYPSTVYARIHELSGWAGAAHRSFIPKRPYVEPARDATVGEVRDTFYDHWRGAMPGR
jgi:hypothetical protein